jgi:replicative DNA helicase
MRFLTAEPRGFAVFCPLQRQRIWNGMTDLESAPLKSIPANLEAERAVLGSLMIDPDAIIKVASFLRAEDFYRERHAWLYEAMLALNERREPLDFVTISDELERREQLEEIGGPAFLTDLISNTPTALYIDHYARIVERTAVLRRLIGAAGKIAELAYDESQEVDDVVDRAEQIIFGVSESRIHRDLQPIRAIMNSVVDRIDFLARNQGTLMGVPTGFTLLDRLLGGMQKSDLIILAGRPGMGKCVTGQTRIVDPTTGELHTIQQLVQQRRAHLLTLNHAYKLELTAASDFIHNGCKPVYRVTTALGREIEVTATHPLLTIEGWRRLSELQVGKQIALPRSIPVFGQDDAPEHFAKVLAYLLADGCMTHVAPQFTSANPRLRDDFIQAALQFPGTKVRIQHHDRSAPTVYVSGDLTFIQAGRTQLGKAVGQRLQQSGYSASFVANSLGVSPSLVYQWVAGKVAPSESAFAKIVTLLKLDASVVVPGGLASISKNRPNRLTQWLQEQGVWGKPAADKTIPATVFRYTRAKLALFLNRLFACDGSVYIQNKSQPAISYSTVSKQLAHDVQHLLLRFGILAKLRHRQIKYQGTLRPAYEIRITDATSLLCFCSEIGVFGKETAIAAVINLLQSTSVNPNRDTIPLPIWEQVIAHKGQRTWRTLYDKMGLPAHANIHVGKRAPTRQRLLEIARALESAELINLAESDLYWDEIAKIESIGEQEVYDLTVPGTHNFIANDIVVHNSSFGLSIAQNAAKRFDARVAVFSLEMSNEQLVQRLLSMETGIDSHRLRLGAVQEDEWPILLEAANMLAKTNIYIDDTPGASVMDIRTKARRLYAEHGLDLIVIDYMQLMSGQLGMGRNDNRQQEISYISRSLKGLARELNVPVIALSQLSRAVESRADKRPMLSDLRESGCLTGDTLVYLPREGVYLPIQSLVGQSGLEVASLNPQTWKLESASVSTAFCTGVKPVFRLTTQTGRTIRATANHQFLTIHGWKRLDELSARDHLALPRRLAAPEVQTLASAELALLGHLIGDGCLLPRHAVQYTTREQDLAQIVAELAYTIFGDTVLPTISPERGWFQVYLSAAQKLARGKRNPVAAWADKLGIFGLRSFEKFVPAEVFKQPAEAIGLFLRHLWATDGCIRMTYGKSPRPAIFYASSSERLAFDVQALLLRFGINAKVRRVGQGTKGRPQYHVIISGLDDVNMFALHIGATGGYRQASLDEIVAWQATKIANTNRDILPRDVWRLYAVPAMQRVQMTTREMQAQLGNQYCGTSLYSTNLSRQRVARLAQVVRSDELATLASSDVYWDKIVSVEPDGLEPVFDLTVPGNHNFVAGNIVVHNSIEQDADVVLFIYREDYYIEETDRQNIADVLVAKHRHGATGTVSLYFRKELTQFRDLEIQRTELDY